MKRGVVAGSSVAASTMVFLALFRGSGPAPRPAAPATPGSVQSVRSTGASSGKQPVRARLEKRPEDGPWKASQDRFAGWPQSKCADSLPKDSSGKDIAELGNVFLRLENKGAAKAALDQKQLHSYLWCIPPGHENVRVLIAIVPDPMQTNMQLQFDRMIDGIQLAAASAGYVIDHYWVPWERPQSIEYADHSSRKAALQDQQEKQKQPGLLLFRWNRARTPTKPDTLFMFLVSDTSTTGVNGRQFKNALEYIGEVCWSERNCGKNPITIIGPSFSGSLASLRHLTEDRKENFYAYSGTVSSACAAWNQDLRRDNPMVKKECDFTDSSTAPAAPGGQPKNLHLKPFMHDTENTLALITRWLHDINQVNAKWPQNVSEAKPQAGDYHCDLAIFAEAGTTYGIAAEPTAAADTPCHFLFAYPREISSLRNAYPDQEATSGTNPTSPITGSSYLPFNLADRGSNRSDEPPDFSRIQGPLSREALLMSYAAELRRQHIRYAGVTGSNVLDVLFLTNFLRKACPDVRLFVLNGDLLFEHDVDNSPYIGALTLTTYPLILRNLDWQQESENYQGPPSPQWRLPFADEAQEGEYNAASFAITKLLDGAGCPDLREVQLPFERKCDSSMADELPLWLTAVGYGGHWPVALLTPESPAAKADPELRSEDFSPAWTAFGAIVCLFSVLHILGLLTNLWPRIRVNTLLLSRPDIDRRFLFVNMASAALVTVLAMLFVPILKFSKAGAGLQSLGIIMAALGALIVVLCIRLGIQQWLPEIIRKSSWHRLGLGLLTLMVWPVASLAVFAWWNLQGDDPYHYGFFFAYRSVHLATGVSPLTPMIPLLAGIYCWALFEGLRLKFADDVRPGLRPRTARRTMDLPGGSTEESVAKSVNDFLLQTKYLCWLWLVFLLWLWSLHPLHPFEIFEWPSYGWIYQCFFALGVFLMLSSGFRLGQIWSELKKLLAELDQSRITPAFKRIREQSWSPIWDSGAHERAWTNIDRCVQIMETVVVNKPKALHEDGGVQRLTNAMNKELETNEELRCENAPSRGIQVRVKRLLQRTMRLLSAHWSTTGLSTVGLPAVDEVNEDSRDQKIVVVCANPKKVDPLGEQIKRLEEFVALRYVAFIGGVLYQIRLLIIIVAVLFTLVLLSLNIYSFEPHQSLIWSFTAMFAVIGFVIVNVLREVHRDNVLSRVTGTKANELGLDFYVRVAAFGAAPLAALLATHFPAIGRYLVSFLQPGLEAVK